MPTETPWAQQAITYHAREDRRAMSRLPVQPGVVNSGDFKVTPGSGLGLNIAAGDAWVAGSHAGVVRQGLYPVALASADTATVGAAHATLPRIDQVVLRVRDAAPAPAAGGDAENSGKIEVVAGTATSGATLDNRTGAAALPVSSLRLADILVPAAFTGPFVQNTHIRDRRAWALGARTFKQSGAGADFNITSTSFTTIDNNLTTRVELSGGLTLMTLTLRTQTSATAVMQWFRIKDGAGSTIGPEYRYNPSASFEEKPNSFIFVVNGLSGTFVFTPEAKVTSGTMVVKRSEVLPTFSIIEYVQASGSNDGA